MMEFEANPDYYRGQPKIERVVLKFLPGAATEATELASGNVQAAWVPRADLLKLRRDPRFLEYYSIGPHILRTIAWNQRHPFFHDTAVRLALTLAIDRRELYQALNLPDAIPILDGPTARYAPWRELPDPLPYDPARAKELLEGAGWLDTDGDGAREREGQRFRFAMLNQAEGGDAAAVYVQAALRRVGVEVQIQRAERRVIQQRIGAGRFDAASLAMNFGTQALLSWFGPESVLGYSAGRATPVLGRLESTLDPDEIARLHRELMLILQADVPATFLFPNVETTVASRNLRGLSSPYHADALRYLENLWLEEVS
jgi:peptide/nickel transport system substrate-binding protein